MEHPYKQEKQMQMNDKPCIKEDNRIYRIQNPIRNELSLAIIFLFKTHISKSVKKTAEAQAQRTAGRQTVP